jgi:2,4'-dihydroxyacetophenone dioxygenase
MPEAAQTEFWRDLKPITKVFQEHSLPEMYTPDIATDDERYYVPLTETVGTRPVWISVAQNSWCDVLRATSAGLVNRHYHPHEVFAYTISGKWGYLEHDWTATAGDFVYETPGEAHTLVAYESDEPMKVHFKVRGPLIWLDEDGEAVVSSTYTTTSSCARSTTGRSAWAPITSTRSCAERPHGGAARMADRPRGRQALRFRAMPVPASGARCA